MTSLPSPAQIALALAVVKHKPVGLDIKDYFLQIRRCLKQADVANQPLTQEQRFDSVLFWRQAFEKSEAEQGRLLDRIFDLERHNEALLSKVQAHAKISESNQDLSKRKAATQKATCKRPKTQLSPGSNGPVNQKIGGQTDGNKREEYSEESTAPFMRYSFRLQKAMQKKQGCADIIPTIAMLCQVISDEFDHTLRKTQQPVTRLKGKMAERPTHELDILFHSTNAAFCLLPRALKKISNSEKNSLDVGRATYHMISLYESILNALKNQCEQARANPGSTRKPPRAKQTNNSPSEPHPDRFSCSISGTAMRICQALNAMVLALDFSCAAHHDLLEGILYHVLSRVGKVLCLFTFKVFITQPGLSCDSSALPLPKGLTSEVDEKSIYAAEMEGRCLIWLLERLLRVFNSTSPSRLTSKANGARHDAFLSTRGKEILQKTLLQAIWGENPESDGAIRPPTQAHDYDIKEFQSCPMPDNMSVSDWFVQEVWRLVGWDILTTNFPPAAS